MNDVSSPTAPPARPAEAPPSRQSARNRRRGTWLVLVAILAVAGGYAGWHWPATWQRVFGPPVAAPVILVSGNIEAHQSMLSFTQVQAPIVDLPFDEGAYVERDTVLARVDDRLYRQQVEIDRTNLNVADAQVSANQSNLSAAQNSVVSDQFDFSEKQRDYARAEQLFKTHVDSEQMRDLALTARNQAAAVLARDQAMVEAAQHNITLAKAAAAAAQAKLELDQVTFSYTVLRAPFNGVISVREAELGQLAGPGVPIFTLDDLDHVWLRAYVNETDIGKVRLHQRVDVTTDTYPNHVYQGHVSFISPEAEFTPKTVETHAERVTLVYRVRIDIDNPTHELLPGMPADARITPLAAGQP